MITDNANNARETLSTTPKALNQNTDPLEPASNVLHSIQHQ
jgi:hypothetical protein